ncbi:hypothetical protein [Lactococcus lactis]|uniref:hypothetical protein n=1 Tax=Lactococcus lactis TaxID=1358 RepID=UPI0021A415A3|nr:hypothetical protein [Lactococcus lactis]MCT3125293.1 hypothetical protein [Lactococcus lactis]
MKNQLLLEAPKQDHEIIITEIEAADKLMKDTTELSKWRRVKAHIKRNKAAYIAEAIGVGTAITASLVIKNQHDQINKLENMTDLMSEMIVEADAEIEELRAENDELQTDLANSLKENQDLNNEYSWMRGGRGL